MDSFFFLCQSTREELFLEHTDHFDKMFSLFHSFNAIWSTRKKHPTKIKMVIGCRDVIYDYSSTPQICSVIKQGGFISLLAKFRLK
ncbi:unnamed protein product [Rhizophagus irregularis]|nr:unnamed protein product [Rhizophagus irregularis]